MLSSLDKNEKIQAANGDFSSKIVEKNYGWWMEWKLNKWYF